MNPFIRIEEPPAAAQASSRFALWELGFRPFYLLASVFAAGSVLLWAAQFVGWIAHPYLAGPLWHAHEMLFGFTLAVIVGFLFTAGRNWSNRPTPTGWVLAALAALWLAGRVLVLSPWAWAAAVVSTAFPLAAAVALAIPFWASRNQRNYFFVGFLVMMGVAEFGIHLAQLGMIAVPAWVGIQLALDMVLFIMAVMAGRVLPMFTNNGIPGAGAARNDRLEKAALGSLIVLGATDLLPQHTAVAVAIAFVCAALHLARWLLWRPWKTLHTPLVWVLHAAYAWIPMHLALRGMGALGWVPPTLATHALTVGAIGGLVIGMMTRTSRGHTGRPLRADHFDVACYLLVLAAGVARVILPLALPAQYLNAVVGSAMLWSAGFALFALRYWPVLSRSRLDGKPG